MSGTLSKSGWLGHRELGRIASQHPVLRLALAQENLQNNEPLRVYVEEFILLFSDLPITLGEFSSSYLDYRLADFYGWALSRHVKPVWDLGLQHVLDNLGQAALHEEVQRHRPISRSLLFKLFPAAKTAEDLQGYLLGLMTVRSNSKNQQYVFNERFVQKYLAARYIFRVLLKRQHQGHEVKLTSPLREYAALFPATVDIWAMALGLMNNDGNMKRFQCPIFEEVVDACRLRLSPHDRLMFQLQVAFEAGDVDRSADYRKQLSYLNMVEASKLVCSSTSRWFRGTTDATARRLYCVAADVTPDSRGLYLLAVLGRMVPCSDNLFQLKLAHFGLGVANIEHLIGPQNGLSAPDMQHVDLSYNDLFVYGLQYLQDFFAKATMLTSLDLSGCQLGDIGLKALVRVLPSMPLHALMLRSNNITRDAGKPLLDQLQVCPTLHTLDVSINKLDDRWLLLFLLQLPRKMQGLYEVDLRDNCISQSGERALESILVAHQQLCIQYLHQSPLQDPPQGFYDDVMKTDEEPAAGDHADVVMADEGTVAGEHEDIMKINEDAAANNQGDVMKTNESAAADANDHEDSMKTNESAAGDHEDCMTVVEASVDDCEDDLNTVKTMASQCVKDVMKAVGQSSLSAYEDERDQRVVEESGYFEGNMNIASPSEPVLSTEEKQQLPTITREEPQHTPAITLKELPHMPITPKIIISGSEGDGTDAGVFMEKVHEEEATATKLHLDESALPSSNWEEMGPRESTPVSWTRRSLYEARRQFFNQTQSATQIGEGYLEGTDSGDRCKQPRISVGGGPLERLRTIEGSNAKQSLNPRNGTEVD